MKLKLPLFLVASIWMLVSFAQKSSIDVGHVPAPLFNDPIFEGPADPSIIWNDQRKEWWIFYTQRRANQHFESGVTFAYGTNIGIAASKDNGKSWYYIGQADFQSQVGTNTFWAPAIFKEKDNYHMMVTFIEGVHNGWEGTPFIHHYESKDLIHWKFIGRLPGTDNCIDPFVYKMADGTWKMWYKNYSGHTATAHSNDLQQWTLSKKEEVNDCNHEAPVVFKWKGSYWMITDPCSLRYTGLKVYKSPDATHWTFNNDILNNPGKRKDDGDQGRHADVVISDGQAFILYFTHPGRQYDVNSIEVEENNYEYQRSTLQMAELEYVNGKIICNRNKYAN